MLNPTTSGNLPARRLIIPFFIGNRDCARRCVFCRQDERDHSFAGENAKAVLRKTVSTYLDGARPKKKGYVQIAFYGGNFTGLDLNSQEELLSMAAEFVYDGPVQSLRISTRPDFLADDRIKLLKRFPVRTVEIGAQSMMDAVLSCSQRGHSSADIERALAALKKDGFETVIHLMAGLPGDNREGFLYSVGRIIGLGPDAVRIHPALVFSGTGLADLYRRGSYTPLSMDEAVDLCREAVTEFEKAGIPVIRLGLQPTEVIEEALIAGPYHPAFRSLVEGEIFFAMASHLLASVPRGAAAAAFHISPADSSLFRGLNNRNMNRLRERAFPVEMSLRVDSNLEKGALKLEAGGVFFETNRLLAGSSTRAAKT